MALPLDELREIVTRKIPTPLLATVAGDHLRGLAEDGDPCTVAGAMVLPLRDVLGLRPARETKERQLAHSGREITLVFHDVRHYLDRLARTANTRLLEELYSPHVIIGGEDFERLKAISRSFVNRICFHDFQERIRERRRRLEQSRPAPVRHLLESARLCLVGARLLETGEMESNISTLADEGDAPWLKPFIRRHLERRDAALLDEEELRLLAPELDRLEEELGRAHARSRLPETVGSITMFDEFLVELRLRELQRK